MAGQVRDGSIANQPAGSPASIVTPLTQADAFTDVIVRRVDMMSGDGHGLDNRRICHLVIRNLCTESVSNAALDRMSSQVT